MDLKSHNMCNVPMWMYFSFSMILKTVKQNKTQPLLTYMVFPSKISEHRYKSIIKTKGIT